jgi:hypothetical protein
MFKRTGGRIGGWLSHQSQRGHRTPPNHQAIRAARKKDKVSIETLVYNLLNKIFHIYLVIWSNYVEINLLIFGGAFLFYLPKEWWRMVPA